MKIKGFTFTLSFFSLIATILIAVVVIFSTLFMVIFHIHIKKTFVVERIVESTIAHDALLALLEMEQDGIKFRQALIYSIYEKQEQPKIWNGKKIVEYDIKKVAKDFMEYVFESEKYWLFLYNESLDEIETIASSDENPEKLFEKDNKKSKRASFPIDEKRWLILYLKTIE